MSILRAGRLLLPQALLLRAQTTNSLVGPASRAGARRWSSSVSEKVNKEVRGFGGEMEGSSMCAQPYMALSRATCLWPLELLTDCCLPHTLAEIL